MNKDDEGRPLIEANTFAIVSPTDARAPRLHPVLTVDEQGRVTGLLFDAQSAPTTATVVAEKLTVNGVELTPGELRAAVETTRAVSEIASSIARVTGRIDSADGARYIDFDTMSCDPETWAGMTNLQPSDAAPATPIEEALTIIKDLMSSLEGAVERCDGGIGGEYVTFDSYQAGEAFLAKHGRGGDGQ